MLTSIRTYKQLSGKTDFDQDEIQEKSFREIKNSLTKASILGFYDPSKQIIIISDASCYGIGACLF